MSITEIGPDELDDLLIRPTDFDDEYGSALMSVAESQIGPCGSQADDLFEVEPMEQVKEARRRLESALRGEGVCLAFEALFILRVALGDYPAPEKDSQ